MIASLRKLDGELMAEIAQRLRLLRQNAGLNQQQLADRIGVSRKHIVDIEAGKGTSLLVFIKLLKVFGKEEKLIDMLEGVQISPKAMFYAQHK
jgi:DNA-binding XRE family transcriptional regulator